jgi:hypothetical protein
LGSHAESAFGTADLRELRFLGDKLPMQGGHFVRQLTLAPIQKIAQGFIGLLGYGA